jgi:hypothetical protein
MAFGLTEDETESIRCMTEMQSNWFRTQGSRREAMCISDYKQKWATEERFKLCPLSCVSVVMKNPYIEWNISSTIFLKAVLFMND